jgi:hypothetical protein
MVFSFITVAVIEEVCPESPSAGSTYIWAAGAWWLSAKGCFVL